MEYRRGRSRPSAASPMNSSASCGCGSRPGGLLHYGQGKWYPGESLPRWAFGLYWRKDGVPIWKNSDLIADIDGPHKADVEEAQNFAEKARSGWALTPNTSCPPLKTRVLGYRRKQRYQRMSIRAIPRLSDPEERSRMARIFDKGLTEPRGFVLPFQRWNADAGKWESERWQLRRSNLFLTRATRRWGFGCRSPRCRIFPPTNIRTSSSRIRWSRGSNCRCLTERRRRAGRISRLQEQQLKGSRRRSYRDVDRDPRRRAVRFMPPVEKIDDYLELIAAVEATAEDMQVPGAFRGLSAAVRPPHRGIKVTPDPGVIEVNIQPARAGARRSRSPSVSMRTRARSGSARINSDRWPPHRDRRRQPCGDRRRHAEDSPFLRRPDL